MKAATGENLIQMLAGAGSLLGLPAIVGKQPYSLTAIALKGAEVRFLSRKDFEEILRADPSLSINVCQVLAAEVQSAGQVLSRF
jgi:CRP-like cAMP-binding protein